MSNRNFQRTSRVSAQLRKLIAELVDREVKDPRVDGVTITDVEVTGDLREARVYFSHPGDEDQDQTVLTGLSRASGFIRREMGRRIQMRVTPSIEFRIDRSLAYGARIEKLFKDINDAESTDRSQGTE